MATRDHIMQELDDHAFRFARDVAEGVPRQNIISITQP